MAQLGTRYGGLDIACKNYGASLTITEGSVVLIDTANVEAADAAIGVLAPTNGGGVVGTLGIATMDIAPGKVGNVRVQGTYWCYCNGGVTAGAYLQASDTAAKLGWVKTCGAATQQIGQALNTANDGDKVDVLICKANNA